MTPLPSKPLQLRTPYLLFLGNADVPTIAKTAIGIHHWAPELCLGQSRLSPSAFDLGLPDLSAQEASALGAGSLVIGAAPVGGALPEDWWPWLRAAVEAGLDVVSGLHVSLTEVPGLAELAERRGVELHDVRLARRSFPVATGVKRAGRRLLTVGTDCALGKKYTALAIVRALQARGVATTFRATGQTGIIIAGQGVAVDAVVADFVAGAAEALSPAAAPDHWDVIEGQGSLFHPAYAGVTLGLVHGSQPDALVLCHEPGRTRLHSYPDYPTPRLRHAAETYLSAARLTNPSARLVAVSLNTSKLDARKSERALEESENELSVPAFDPLRSSPDPVINEVLRA